MYHQNSLEEQSRLPNVSHMAHKECSVASTMLQIIIITIVILDTNLLKITVIQIHWHIFKNGSDQHILEVRSMFLNKSMVAELLS